MSALVAVYPDRRTANAAAAALHDRMGVDWHALRVSTWGDVGRSFRAEIESEAAESWASFYGVTTPEMTRRAVTWGLVGGVVGLVIGLPLGLLYGIYESDSSVLLRFGVGALIGVLFGSVVGAILGGGMSIDAEDVDDPDAPADAEHGVPVVVDDPPAEAEAVLKDFEPVRIDRFEGDQRVRFPTPRTRRAP